MNSFLLEIWHDLKAKRLWPVAFLLALAVAAIPLMLRKSSEEPAASTPAAVAGAQEAPKSKVVLAADNEFDASRLEAFTRKNPFNSLIKHRSASSSTSSSATSTATIGESPSSEPSSGGATGGGSTGGTTDPVPSKPKVTAFTYVADVTFGQVGHLKRIDGLRKLQMLPSSDNPLLIFLGATSGGDDAVFLVDSTLKQAGEGHCADKACSLLSIGPGSEHHFVDDKGKEYVLRIDSIRKVKVGAVSARASARTSVAHTARSAVGQTVHTAAAKTAATGQAVQSAKTESAQRARAFVSALLVDVVTAASTDAGP